MEYQDGGPERVGKKWSIDIVWVQKFFIMGWDRDPQNQSSGD